MEITLINHQSFLKIVQENLLDFQQVIGEKVEAQQILEGYLSGAYFNQIRHHDGLLGILLGYGKINSWSYMNESQRNLLGYFEDDTPEESVSILLPMFRANFQLQKTQDLRAEYLHQRELLRHVYKDQQFLIPTLLKLSE